MSAIVSSPFVCIAASRLAWATLPPLFGQAAWKPGTQNVVAPATLGMAASVSNEAVASPPQDPYVFLPLHPSYEHNEGFKPKPVRRARRAGGSRR